MEVENDEYNLKTWFTKNKCGDLYNSKYAVGTCFLAQTWGAVCFNFWKH